MRRMNDLERIYSEMEKQKKEYDECSVKIAREKINDIADGNEERFLLLKAQQMTVIKNLDLNLHVSIIAMVVSFVALITSLLSFMDAVVSKGVEDGHYLFGFSGIVMALVLVMMIAVGSFVVCAMGKVIKYMRRQEIISLMSLCLEEHEKERLPHEKKKKRGK